MADVKISALPAATPSNTSILPAVVGGITSQVTTVQIFTTIHTMEIGPDLMLDQVTIQFGHLMPQLFVENSKH